MFRPYNLTSITAWTVGSLAGNKAYYATKQKQAGLIINRSGSPAKSLAPAGNPAYVQKIFKKCINLDEEIAKLHSDLGSAYDPETSKLNTTPLLKLIAYCNWLNSRKDQIKEDIRTVLDRAMREGYVYGKSTQTLLAETDDLVKTVNFSKDDILRQLNEILASTPQIKSKAFEIMDQIMASMEVDERTWKLKEFKRDGLNLVGPNQKSQRETDRPKEARKSCRHDFTKDLYIARGSETLGPYKYSQLLEWLKTGNVSLEELVAYDGAPTWVKLEELIAKVTDENRDFPAS